MLTCLTAGESHGPQLTAIISGLPANLPLAAADIDLDLARRQCGYGRGGRMTIERDRVEFRSGVRHGLTTGAPLTLVIANRDWENWERRMSAAAADRDTADPVTRPRPGHADLPGCLKYCQHDTRNILERASARETAIRTAVGATAKKLLAVCGIRVWSWVTGIGNIDIAPPTGRNPEDLHRRAEESPFRITDPNREAELVRLVDDVKQAGDSLGGTFQVAVTGVPAGLGSHIQHHTRLDGRLAQAMMSIQAIKGVEIGIGFAAARRRGSTVHDPIGWKPGRGFGRESNRAGGIEGGMSNGEDILLTAAMKPIPTLYQPLASVDMISKEPFAAGIERSDVCAVPAAAVVGEAAAAWEIAAALLEKFGGDHLDEIRRAVETYRADLATF
ncbi:MAG: chorismate synthase [Deltaproteobacteria bacterium]|nr:chorismate synthase [Candidatus Anaeroferrophillacea bacterium]